MSLWDVGTYVRLRSGGDDEALESFARAHVAPGAAVLEVGCGPGRASAALATRHGAQVTAVDVSREMLAAAREIAPPEVTLVEAPAEALPFADTAFDVAVAQMVVHLLDRPRAFFELRRVLRPGGILWVKTSDPHAVEQHWLSPLAPSFAAIERSRFPDEATLRRELEEAGFAVETAHRALPRAIPRETALAQLRGHAYSTVALLPDDERTAAERRAETTLPDPVAYEIRLLLALARRR